MHSLANILTVLPSVALIASLSLCPLFLLCKRIVLEAIIVVTVVFKIAFPIGHIV